MVYYPSSFFKGRNLFHLAEMLSTCTALVGNSLAILGAAVSNAAVVNFLGVVFAVVNMSFGLVLFFGYSSDTKKRKSIVTPVLEGGGVGGSASTSKAIPKEALLIEKEWNTHIALTEGCEKDSKGRRKMFEDMFFLRSKARIQANEVLVAMEVKAAAGEGTIGVEEKTFLKELLKNIERDYVRLQRDVEATAAARAAAKPVAEGKMKRAAGVVSASASAAQTRPAEKVGSKKKARS